MNMLAGPRPLILPVAVLTLLGLSALGFQYFAVHAFDIGTDHECIPKFAKSPAAKCVKQR
jgi:hypothetical protein